MKGFKDSRWIDTMIVALAAGFGEISTADAQPLRSIGFSDIQPVGFGVTVDCRQSIGIARDVYGVNNGPLAIISDTQGVDHTSLYQRAKIHSVRLHDAGIDASQVYSDDTVVLSSHDDEPVLQWEPNHTDTLSDPENYEFDGPDRQYQSVLDGGFEPYLRVGESWNGPNYSTQPEAWGTVAANVVRHFFGAFAPTRCFSVQPAFVEIWNEPDGRFWSGSVDDFERLHDAAYARLSSVTSVASLGGPGFTRSVQGLDPSVPCRGSDTALGGAAFARCYMQNVRTDARNFVSFHYYGDDTEGRETRPSGAVGALLDSVHNLRDSGASELHLTEWNASTGADANPGLFTSARIGAFASAMWSWLQATEFSEVTRAHFYAGSQIGMAEFFYDIQGTSTLCPGTRTNCFHVRASALAMSLHGDLAGLPLAPATLVSAPLLVTGFGWPSRGTSVVNAALADWPVTAVATDDGSVASVVITNLSSAERSVRLRLRSLGGRRCARVRSLSGYDANAAYVSAITVNNNTVADPSGIDAVFGRFISTRYESLTLSDDSSDRAINVGANGVVRVDVRGAAWPLSVCLAQR